MLFVFLQLSDLRPGRSYAVRVICEPVLIDKDQFDFEPDQSLVSLPAIFNTPPTPPSAPQAPTLSAKEKRELAVPTYLQSLCLPSPLVLEFCLADMATGRRKFVMCLKLEGHFLRLV